LKTAYKGFRLRGQAGARISVPQLEESFQLLLEDG